MLGIYVGSRANFGRLKGLLDLLNAKGEEYRILGNTHKLDNEYDALTYLNVHLMNNIGFVVSELIHEAYRLFRDTNMFNRILVHGDRWDVFAVAQAAFLAGIKIYHTEGGEESGCLDNTFRKCISAMASVHLANSEKACEALKACGYSNIHNVGSLALDDINRIIEVLKHNSSYYLKNHILCVYNPVTDRAENPEPYMESLKDLVNSGYSLIIIEPCNDPGKDEILDLYHKYGLSKYVVGTLMYENYIATMYFSSLVIGNTSSGIKEAAFMEKPYILIGSRQNNREHDFNTIRVPMVTKLILEEVSNNLYKSIKYSGIWGYGDSAEKIYKILKEG